jgi:hypothetical protein
MRREDVHVPPELPSPPLLLLTGHQSASFLLLILKIQADPTESLLRTNNLKSKSSYQLNHINSQNNTLTAQNAQKFCSR